MATSVLLHRADVGPPTSSLTVCDKVILGPRADYRTRYGGPRAFAAAPAAETLPRKPDSRTRESRCATPPATSVAARELADCHSPASVIATGRALVVAPRAARKPSMRAFLAAAVPPPPRRPAAARRRVAWTETVRVREIPRDRAPQYGNADYAAFAADELARRRALGIAARSSICPYDLAVAETASARAYDALRDAGRAVAAAAARASGSAGLDFDFDLDGLAAAACLGGGAPGPAPRTRRRPPPPLCAAPPDFVVLCASPRGVDADDDDDDDNETLLE